MKKVTLYWVPEADASMLAKSHLDEKDVSYTAIDVSQPDGARQLARQTKQWTAPVLVVGNDAVIGYEPDMYNQLLSKR